MQSLESEFAAAERLPWYNVWIDVTTSPSKETFRRILADPSASPFRAYLWLGLVSLLLFFPQVLVLQVTEPDLLRGTGNGFFSLVLLCGGIATPLGAVLAFVINTGILHFIAGLLGGSGSFDDLAYSMGAVQAPVIIFSGLISLISTLLAGRMVLLGLIIAPVSLAISIYALVLQVMAVSVAEKVSTGRAVLIALVPIILVLVLAGCLVAFGISSLASQFGSSNF